MLDEETALYLFCFARADLTSDLPGTGLDDHPILVQNFPSASAVFCEVSREKFCGPGAEDNLKDLAWVAPRACRHEQVIEKVMESSPVLPARFATLFSSVGSLRQLVQRESEAISQFLDRVADKEEWAVRAMADMATMKQAAVAREMSARSTQLTALSPGNRYFQEKKIRTEAETSVRDWLDQVCHEAAAELREHAAAFTERQVFDAGEELKSVVSWAFLLPKEKLPGFREQLESANGRLRQAGLVFNLSGPWPPYSFTPSLSTESLG